jgi:protein-disulfide isomerase-like protein with CxxC motif
MSTELFFLYDTHCPWSYVATPLVEAIHKSLPEVDINLWHCAHFCGEEESKITKKQIAEVKSLADISYSPNYIDKLSQPKDSTLSANLMTWAANKTPKQALALLKLLQKSHFEEANELTHEQDVADIIAELKLSPPSKVLKSEKLTSDAEAQVHEIFALQEIIATEAIPALLLAIDDQLILLNHNFYLDEPSAIVEAVKLEIENSAQL